MRSVHCVQNTGKEALHQVLTTSAEGLKEAASLKVKGPLYSCPLIAHLPSGSRDIWKPSIDWESFCNVCACIHYLLNGCVIDYRLDHELQFPSPNPSRG